MMILRCLFLTIICGISIPLQAQNVFGFEYRTNGQDSVLVTKILKNSPAEKAGLKSGDLLNFLNDIPLAFKSREELQKILSNAPTSNNELRIYRNPDVFKIIIHKADFSTFQFICKSGSGANGNCEVETAYGNTIKGICTNGKINGKSEIYNENNQLIYKGNILDNIADGSGVEYLENNNRIEALYKNGKKTGYGKIFLPDGSYLACNFKDNELDGIAQLFSTDNKLLLNMQYEKGKKISESKPTEDIQVNLGNNAETKATTKTSTVAMKIEKKEKVLTKDPALVNSILEDKKKTTAWLWETRYFKPEKVSTPLRQKPPFSNSEYKKFGVHYLSKVSPDGLKKITEQCAFENWPSFYKQYPNLDELFKGPFRNLIVQEVFTFKNETKNSEYQMYGIYTIIYIADKYNPHAPNELLSDDGVGFFMCVPNSNLQEGKSNTYIYTDFTLDNYSKNRGFQNWTTKKRAYIFDLSDINEEFYIYGYDSEVKKDLNINDAEMAKLKEWCSIKYRPTDLNTAEKVKSAQRNGKFLDVVVYNLVLKDIGNILYMPTNENMHLPSGMRPQNSDGWYFTTNSIEINYEPPSEKTKSRILATTDAAMAKYEIEQAAREAQMKKTAEEIAEWRFNNVFKGVVIYQISGGNYNSSDAYSYKVVSIFGPPNQKLLSADKPALDKIAGVTSESDYNGFQYKEGMNEAQAESFITSTTGSHRFSINNNYTYTIPKREAYSNTTTATYQQLEDEISKNNEKAKELMQDIYESKSADRKDLLAKSVTDIFNGKNFIEAETKVAIVDVLSSDKFYNENKKHIGETGIVEMLTENGDGTYYGMIKFDSEDNTAVFYSVIIKVLN